MKNILEWFVEEAKSAFGDNLKSILLYGSKASRQGGGAKSDHNVLILLDEVSARDLKKLAKPVRKWVAEGNPAPMIFSELMFSGSSDVFPVEFLDMQMNRKVLFGNDPVKDIYVDQSNLRHQCEYELKVILLGLRKSYMLARNDKELKGALAGSISAVLSVLKHAVTLFGERAPEYRMDALDLLKSKLGADPEVFKTILNIKHKDPSAKSIKAEPLFDRYLAEIEKIVNAVDGM
jgi:hypothetical protein